MTPAEVAKSRYSEASRVKDAYESCVVKRREAWRKAPVGPAADKARRLLAHAVEQLAAAKATQSAAWAEWHKHNSKEG